MRSLSLGILAVGLVAVPLEAGEDAGVSPKAEARVIWVSVPGELNLLRVENPPDGLIPRDRQPRRPGRGEEQVSRAVNRELRDVAQALRGLDQSYAIRGFQGCGAATAGSVFVDWRARGLRRPENAIVLPPAPIVLGIPKWHTHCSQCARELIEENGECDCLPTNTPPAPLPPAPTLIQP